MRAGGEEQKTALVIGASGGEEALLSVEQSIPFVANVLEANLDTPGLRFVDRFGESIAW